MIRTIVPTVAGLTFRPQAAPEVSITVRAGERGVSSVVLTRARSRASTSPLPSSSSPQSTVRGILDQVVGELEAYFQGTRRKFSVPLDWEDLGSDFDVRVWRALALVPFGVCVSYADLAQGIDRPRAARAVGGAVGRNPLPILIPCHRVIGSGGSLTGFSCGLDLKVLLLELEGFSLSPARQTANRLVLA